MIFRPRILRRRLPPFAAALSVALWAGGGAADAAQRSPQGTALARGFVLARLRTQTQTPDTRSPEDALARGLALVRDGRYEEAHRFFAALLKERPREPLARYGAALALFNLGRAAEADAPARAAVAEALKGDLTNAGAKHRAADALVLLAVIVAVRGDNAAALAPVRQAVALAPDHFDAQFTLGRALYGAGDPAGARAAFHAATRLRPEDTRALFFYATSLERAGDDEGALTAYRQLVARQPLRAEGHLGLGALLVKLGGAHAAEGTAALLRAVALAPDLYEARVALGRALVRANRASEALEHLPRAAALAPGNPEPHYQLALAYRRLKRPAEAARASALVKQIHESRRGSGGSKTDPSPSSANN